MNYILKAAVDSKIYCIVHKWHLHSKKQSKPKMRSVRTRTTPPHPISVDTDLDNLTGSISATLQCQVASP